MLPAQAVKQWRAPKLNMAIHISFLLLMVCLCYVSPSYAQTPEPPATPSADTTKPKTDSIGTPASTVPPSTTDTSKTKTDKPANTVPPAADTTKANTDTTGNAANGVVSSSADSSGKAGTPSPKRIDDPSDDAASKGGIGKLEDCEIPFTMAYNIKHMTYKELDSLRIEFQKIIMEDEEEKIITIKMHYVNEHITGYMTKAPIHHSNKYIIMNMPIDVKIEWCCVPDTSHPTQHCATTRAELIGIDTTEHCKRWMQRDDGSDMLEQLAANKKKIDLKKYRKKHKFNPLAFLNLFKRKKKKQMIGIPMDKTLSEILKSGSSS